MGTLEGCELVPAGPDAVDDDPAAVVDRSAEGSARDWDWADLGCIIARWRLDSC